jgi:hypothetical protein
MHIAWQLQAASTDIHWQVQQGLTTLHNANARTHYRGFQRSASVPRRRTRNCNGWQRCSDFVSSSCPPANVLFVGAERPDEFAEARQLVCQHHNVTVVNPRESAAARQFRKWGGTFIRARVEQLPLACGRFDLICENYPYPSGEHYVPPRAFALARLSRLAPGGRWVLFTEAVRFATLLKAVGDYDDAIQRNFGVIFSRISHDEAPPSTYPPVDLRFRLIFEKFR